MKAFTLCVCLAVLCLSGTARQDTTTLAGKISPRYAQAVAKKMNGIEEGLTKQSQKALHRLQKQNQNVYKALHPLDSNAAKAFLQQSEQQYVATLARLQSSGTDRVKKVTTYVPGLDSAGSVLKYLSKLPGADALPGSQKITDALSATTGAGQALDKATEVKKLMLQQQQQLKALANQYKDLPIARQLKAYNKEIYYYQQRVQQAKETLNDPAKVEKAVLALLRKNEGFKNWIGQNGQLAQLFGGVGGNGTNPAQTVAGLQTRQSVQALVQSRLGGSLQQAQQAMTGAVQQAQGQMNSMRNSLQQQVSSRLNNIRNRLSGSGGRDAAMPDFKPNNQKTKPFLQRLEKGWNLQATQRRGVFPSVNELGTSIGYKLNDKSVVGVGLAYRFGLGESIGKLRWTNEGISLRSYIDIKWKGNWWISGGYEQNYWSRFSDSQFSELLWQSSALVGITKKITLKKNKEMKLQLLYDFMEKRTTNSPPIKFRVGRSF